MKRADLQKAANLARERDATTRMLARIEGGERIAIVIGDADAGKAQDGVEITKEYATEIRTRLQAQFGARLARLDEDLAALGVE